MIDEKEIVSVQIQEQRQAVSEQGPALTQQEQEEKPLQGQVAPLADNKQINILKTWWKSPFLLFFGRGFYFRGGGYDSKG